MLFRFANIHNIFQIATAITVMTVAIIGVLSAIASFMRIKGSLYKINVLFFSTMILREIVKQFLAFLLSKATKETKNAFCGCACLCDPLTTGGLNKKELALCAQTVFCF
jgi:hypothetical protein